MENRIPTYPSRFLVERADGSEEYVTLKMADEPIVEGTTLDKASLLPDSVCDALGIDRVTSEPKDALIALQTIASSRYVVGTYAGDGTNGRIINLGFRPSAVMLKRCEFGNSYPVAFAVDGSPDKNGVQIVVSLTLDGFDLRQEYGAVNATGSNYNYIAWR